MERPGIAENETYGLGVNLEGKEYDGWPVARLIEREMAHPVLLTAYRDRVPQPDLVRVSWKRDAWQVAKPCPDQEVEHFAHSHCAGPAGHDRLDACFGECERVF